MNNRLLTQKDIPSEDMRFIDMKTIEVLIKTQDKKTIKYIFDRIDALVEDYDCRVYSYKYLPLDKIQKLKKEMLDE